MKIDPESAEIHLADQQAIRLPDAHGMQICCTAGTVWITTSGMAEDIFLQAGERHHIRLNGLSLIEGIGASRIRLEKISRATVWRERFSVLKRRWREKLSRTNPAPSAADFPV